jgi:ectoine hydroxylase-related dioxygenase (phytanoyl-CoA dioxygenase family)
VTIQEALYELGVRDDTLSETEKDQLDRDGYVLLPHVLTVDEVARMRARLDELAAQEGEKAGIEVMQEAGTARLSDLVNKDAMFDVCFTHPRVLAAIAHVLRGEFHFSSLNSRTVLPGEGHQALHDDYFDPARPANVYNGVNTGWLLDDFTERNGPTRVVPGSHRFGKLPQDAMTDPAAPHPDEIKVLAPAGSVIVFICHLWHGGTCNETDQPRHCLHGFFSRRHEEQQTNQRAYLRPETDARLSPAARYILDV